MPADDGTQSRLDELLRAAANDDPDAQAALISHTSERLLALTRNMLRTYPRLRRWEETDDIYQTAMLRLQICLAEAHPSSPRHFFNLAALQIRRTLIDLARRHFGPEDYAANHHTDGDGRAADDVGGPLHAAADAADDSITLDRWALFHTTIGELAEEHREMFDLLWYQGLSQAHAAAVLDVSLRTVKRRWQAARLALHDALATGA